MVTQVHKGRCITEYAAIYGQPPPPGLLSPGCSVWHVWAGFIIVPAVSGLLGCRRYDTHTVIHNPGGQHWGSPDKICFRNNKEGHWHWAMSHWSQLETWMCQIWQRKFVCSAVTQQVKWYIFKNNVHGMLSTDFIWSWVYPFCEFHCWYCVGLLRQCKLFSNILWFLIKLGVPWRMRQTELCVLKIILKPH